MSNTLLDGLSLVDTAGHLILASTFASLVLGVGTTLFLRARYAGLERDLKQSTTSNPSFSHRVLTCIVRDAEEAFRRSQQVNTQAIIEDNFQSELKPLLLAERFVKAATGLVIILGLLGTFYGLTLSIGRLVHLVSADATGVADVSLALTSGLTQALMGMAVAFSNSLLGIVSAVILTVMGVFCNVTDRRTSLMIQVETYLDRMLSGHGVAHRGANLERTTVDFVESIARLDGSIARFESALQALTANTRGLSEFSVRIVASNPRDGR
jgi:hypothetical protein